MWSTVYDRDAEERVVVEIFVNQVDSVVPCGAAITINIIIIIIIIRIKIFYGK